MENKSRKVVPCPYCKKADSSLETGLWPFCSARCQTADIGAWASESYRISAEDSSTLEDEAFLAGELAVESKN